MTSAWSQLEQMLTCAICLDKFKNPRLLPCQHSFCGDACMDGLVDYVRRQIKCPECRAEHRIPYQGVQSLPLNVTLIRFLELHARITGEEPEPVPTFMEKCSICGEKVEGVQRCAHCEKKVCPECKEAHIDLLRREIGRINGQSKRSLSKMLEFRDTLKKSEEKLIVNHATVRHEIEDSCKRLMEDLKTKQKRLLEEVDQFVEEEKKTIGKLKVAIDDEHSILSSNLEIAEQKLIPACDSASGNKLAWLDGELSELKDIYNRSMEFVRLFDPEIGDFNRKIRFTLIPEFDTLRKRICELGELKFTESAAQLIANSFQYCNASGQVAQELCQQASMQQHQQNLDKQAYGLAHSNSNTNIGGSHLFGQSAGSGSGSNAIGISLELPNALMRSQSDHRLASQFQQRLKAQEMSVKNNGGASGGSSGRYGSRATTDYDSDLRSRYAPPRGAKDYSSDLLRDWPRPSDSEGGDFGSSIHFKSAFMRRKEKERYGAGSTYSSALDDEDDLTSEASYSTTGRNVRFYDQQQQQQLGVDAGLLGAASNSKVSKQFETSEVEKAPLSGVPKLEGSPHYHNRLQQMGARSKVEKKELEEQGAHDKDLVESARQAMNKVAAKAKQLRQASEDEVEKQKQANKMQDLQRSENASALQRQPTGAEATVSENAIGSTLTTTGATADRETATPLLQPSSVPASDQAGGGGSSTTSSPATPTAALPGGRRSLYGQAVTERSKRQLSSAIQDASNYARRSGAAAIVDSAETPIPGGSSISGSVDQQHQEPVQPVRRRVLRSGSRSMSKQSSIERQQSVDSSSSGTPSVRRTRRTLAKADSLLSSQQQRPGSSSDTAQANNSTSGSKNWYSGSGASGASEGRDSPTGAQQLYASGSARSAPGSAVDQTPTTTDDERDASTHDTGTIRRRAQTSRQSTGASLASSAGPATWRNAPSKSRSSKTADEDEDDDEDNDDAADEEDEENADEADADEDEDSGGTTTRSGSRNLGNRRSRELLPSAVNRLLDRSAQIRRDSQEQRSRGDSPQRTTPTRSDYSGVSSTSSSFYSSPGVTRTTASGGGGGGGAAASSARQLNGYQRSLGSSRQDSLAGHHEAESSGNSNYTTASRDHVGRHSSTDDSYDQLSSGQQRRQSGGLSSEHNLVETAPTSRYSSGRRDSKNDNSTPTSGYQSRFLARSRTSAALSSASSLRSQEDYQRPYKHNDDNNNSDSPASSARSYLSSRDRFMQSAAMMLPGSSASKASNSHTSSSRDRGATSSSGNTTAGASPSAVVDSARHQHKPPLATAQSKAQIAQYSRYLNNNSPFIGLDDDDDDDDGDDIGAFLTQSGYKTQSEYLRNKFERSRRQSSGNSTSSGGGSFLTRSKSSHRFVGTSAHSSPDSGDEEQLDHNTSDAHEELRRNSATYVSPSSYIRRTSAAASGSRRSSLAGSIIQDYDEVEAANNSVYCRKGRMLFKIGSRGGDPGNFTWPRGVAVGNGSMNRSEIIVADSSNHRVQVFDSEGRFLNEFGSYGSAPGEFDCLAGVSINRYTKNYVVSDRYNHRIQIFDLSGKFVRAFGEYGREQGKFNLPWGVACDPRLGTVYVCDKENHRVQVFDIDGTYLNRFGACGNQAGQLQHPHYIAVGQGRVVVTDTNNHRVQVFDLSGRLIKTIGREGSSPGEFKFPRGVAMDEIGHIIVGDSGNNRLQIFNPEGCFIKSIGTWGGAEGEFKGIEGVAVDSATNNILVCDRENHRIQVF